MLNPEFSLNAKSISRLSGKGLDSDTLRTQLDDDLDLTLELWHSQGLELIKRLGYYYFATKFLPITEAEFCIVDIETNGSKIEKHQIIEIAAVKVKDSKIIDRFESLVQCEKINEHITDITGISVEDTKDAPPIVEVLEKFKLFLGDAVFVAHDVKFDYKFISLSLKKFGFSALLNRSLCSLGLAERTLQSYRYGLSYLNEYYELHPDATHHRAMSDVMTTYKLFVKSLENLDPKVKTVEELIKFSKEAKRLKRLKLDPLSEKEEEE